VIENVDLIVIGGGIHGCGVAADAAGRGLTVALFEQYDLGSQTSNASTKLIHGGLRYLETGQYRLVYDCLKEQKNLLKNASYLIEPIKFIIPIDLSVRPQWMVKLGLFTYDYLRFNGLPKSELLSPAQRQDVGLHHTPAAAFSYYDCMTNDHRLVISDALTAEQLGAKIHTYTQIDTVLSTQEGWIVRAEKDGERWTTRAKAVIILAGPWIREVFSKYHLPFTPPKVSFVQGSHLVVPRLYEGDHALAYQHKDKRLVFFIPYLDAWTLVGTTDTKVSEPQKDPQVTTQERTYLLDVINTAFAKNLSSKDIASEYAGIRCLGPDHKAGARTSRESQILSYKCPSYGHRLLSLIGGKLTSWRLTSEQMVDRLKSTFPHMKPAWTETKIVAGGRADTSLHTIVTQLKTEYTWVPTALIDRWAQLYGLRTQILLKDCYTMEDLGPMIVKDLSLKEVTFLMKTEWACSFSDIVDRRTRLSVGLTSQERKKGYSRFIKYCSCIDLSDHITAVPESISTDS